MADADPISADFARRHPDSFARLLAHAESSEVDGILADLPPATGAAVAARLPANSLAELLDKSEGVAGQWLADARFDDAVTLLSRLPRERRLVLVNALSDRERRQQLLRHQQYPGHSVGSLVGDVPLRFNAEEPVAEALAEIWEIGGDDPGPLVVVDRQGRYLGVLNVWRLLSRKRPTGVVGDYVNRVSPLFPETSIANAANDAGWDRHSWLPVIDSRRRVLGAVSRASLMSASRRLAGSGEQASEFTMELMRELVYAMGELLDLILGRRRPL